MTVRRLPGFVGMSLAAALTGCHIPANSPFTGLAQLRPTATPHTNVLPPAAMLHHPGPGVEGPGPGIIHPASYEESLAAAGAAMAGGGMIGAMAPTSQIGFVGPDGMQVRWDVSMAGGFDSEPLVTPGRYDFPQGAIYRLKLTDIPGREGIELYPSLEVAPVTPRTAAYLAHNAVPFQLTDEDLDQVTTGNFVTKVVYLPDAEYQELAVAGVETLVSTRLDPGVDPVVEADRRGSILGIIRIGNKDLQAPGAAGFGAAGADIIGYELREDFADRAKENVEAFLGADALDRYRVELRDCYDGIDETDLDRVVLDLPEPWQVVPHAAKAMHPGGILLAYTPSIVQVMQLRQALEQSAFDMPETLEVLNRTWHVEGVAVRPDHRMVAHTGFLTHARLLGG